MGPNSSAAAAATVASQSQLPNAQQPAQGALGMVPEQQQRMPMPLSQSPVARQRTQT